MHSSIYWVGAILIASATYLLSSSGSPSEAAYGPYIQGRNNTVLFIANQESGLANVFIATAFSMLQNHPEIQVHYASWADARPKAERISRFAKETTPEAKDVIFHELKGPSFADAILKILDFDSLMNARGWRGIGKFGANIQHFICPWDADEHFGLYNELGHFIDEVDPAVVVVDSIFLPAVDITRDRNRQHIILTPNTHVDNFIAVQPYGSMFWKYPAISSGFSFPVPWSNVPENIYLNARFIYSVMSGSLIRSKQAALRKLGLKNPIDFMHMHRDDVPWITMHTDGASIPVDVVPVNVTSAGPIIVHSAPAEQQDPELTAWMKKAPTILVNLGSSVRYDEKRAVIFANAIADILKRTDAQILWKFMPYGEISDAYLEPLKPYMGSVDRVRLPKWIEADPYALLESGLIAVSVHHGGSGCYHEAISAGVRQVVLPLWADLYNYAALSESLEVGVWGCKETSPEWTSQCLGDDIVRALESGNLMDRAEALGETVRARGKGRDIAAREVAKLARIAP